MYIADISLDEATNITLALKARSRRLNALDRIKNAKLDMRLNKELLLLRSKKCGFEDVDTILTHITEHENCIDAA